MKLLLLVFTITSIIFAQNKTDSLFGLNSSDLFQYASLKHIYKPNSLISNTAHPTANDPFMNYTNQGIEEHYFFGVAQKVTISDSSNKKSRRERSLERKERRLKELADKFTEEELRQKIENYKSSRTSGTVLMSIGIPIFAGGLVSMFVGLNNVDHSNSSSSDDGWVVTALVGEIVAAAGGIMTAYGIIKMSKANSGIRKNQELLNIKTKDMGIRLDKNGLSLCYRF